MAVRFDQLRLSSASQLRPYLVLTRVSLYPFSGFLVRVLSLYMASLSRWWGGRVDLVHLFSFHGRGTKMAAGH